MRSTENPVSCYHALLHSIDEESQFEILLLAYCFSLNCTGLNLLGMAPLES